MITAMFIGWAAGALVPLLFYYRERQNRRAWKEAALAWRATAEAAEHRAVDWQCVAEEWEALVAPEWDGALNLSRVNVAARKRSEWADPESLAHGGCPVDYVPRDPR